MIQDHFIKKKIRATQQDAYENSCVALEEFEINLSFLLIWIIWILPGSVLYFRMHKVFVGMLAFLDTNDKKKMI